MSAWIKQTSFSDFQSIFFKTDCITREFLHFQTTTNPRKSFETALTVAKIENCTMHDLRHTFASYLAYLKVDLYTIAVLLGHKTRGGQYSITARYTHLQQDYLLEVVKKLATYLKDIVPVSWIDADKPSDVSFTPQTSTILH